MDLSIEPIAVCVCANFPVEKKNPCVTHWPAFFPMMLFQDVHAAHSSLMYVFITHNNNTNLRLETSFTSRATYYRKAISLTAVERCCWVDRVHQRY